MTKPIEPKVKVTVISVSEEFPCDGGIKAGDSFIVGSNGACLSITGQPVKCLELLHTVFPMVMTLAHGGDLPWAKDGKATTACPDPRSRVVVALERV